MHSLMCTVTYTLQFYGLHVDELANCNIYMTQTLLSNVVIRMMSLLGHDDVINK